MKKRILLAGAAAAVALVGCNRELAGPDAAALRFAAHLETPTRVALSDAGAFAWQAGDAVALVTNDGIKTLTLSSGDGTTVAAFDGDLTGVTSATNAFFPAGVAKDATTVVLPEAYTWAEGQTNAAMIAEKVSLTEVNTFKHLGGIIKISYAEVPADADALVFHADAAVTGEFAVSEGVITAGAGESTVKIDIPAGSGAKNFYIPVPTGSFKFSVVLQKGGADIADTRKETSSPVTIARRTLLLMDPIGDEALSFTIATAEDFVEFLANADQAAEANITADIDLKGVTLPAAPAFSGVLDGGNHTLSNITASAPLFALNKGEIRNLVITGAFSATAGDAALSLASLAAVSEGTIENVTNKASVSVTGAPTANVAILVGGIVNEAYGAIKDCVNEGAVSYEAPAGAPVYGVAVGGVTAILGTKAEGLVNRGDVSLKAAYPAGKSKAGRIAMKYDLTPAAAGIAAYAVSDGSHEVSVAGASNYGKITYLLSEGEKIPAAPGRVGASGIVANTGGDITDCINYGDVDCSVISSDRTGFTGSTKNIIVHAAGIAANEYFSNTPRSQDMTNVLRCTNKGKINVEVDAYNSNSAIGGVSGWPAVEGTATTWVRDCVNEGDVTVSGAGKSRTGGVVGGATNIDGCINYGKVTSYLAGEGNTGGTLGGVNGYTTVNLKLTHCESYGDVINYSGTTNVYVGGLVGAQANQDGVKCEGCIVNCKVSTSQDQKFTGLVLGRYNGDKTITLGSESEPIKITGGTIVTSDGEVELTADNWTNYVTGTERKNSLVDPTATKRTVYAVFDAAPDTAIKITNAEELAAFLANAHTYTAEDEFKLTTDIVAENFVPATSFAGTLDGRGHTITYAFEATSSNLDAGLIANLTGTVKNLKVAGSMNLTLNTSTSHYGGIAGRTTGAAVIENCESDVDITSATKSTKHIGGILGYADAGTRVSGCRNTGDISVIIPDLGSSNASQLGGIIGHIEGSGTVEDCVNDGNIHYEALGTPRIGGIVSYINNVTSVTFRNCTNNGRLSWVEGAYTASTWTYIGGITAYYGTAGSGSEVLYDNCVNTGEILMTVQDTDVASRIRTGGIMAHGGSTAAGAAMTWTLRNCSNTGRISGNIQGSSLSFYGGLIGYTETSCTLVVENGQFNGEIESKNAARVGGILGGNCNGASTFKNVKVGAAAKLTAGQPYTVSGTTLQPSVAALIGFCPAEGLSQSITGDVDAAVLTSAGETVTLSLENFQEHLVGGIAKTSEVTFQGQRAPVEPGQEKDTTYLARWWLDKSQKEILEAHFNEEAKLGDGSPNPAAQIPGNGGWYVEPNVSGKGRIEFYNGVDKTSLDAVGRCKRVIGGSGGVISYGTWKDDYYLMTAYTDETLPAGTDIYTFFALRPNSDNVPKYWLVEILDGDTWKPYLETSKTTVAGEGEVEFNLELTYDPNGTIKCLNSIVDSEYKLTAPTKDVQIRMKVVSKAYAYGSGLPSIIGDSAVKTANPVTILVGNRASNGVPVLHHTMICVVKDK